MPSKTKFAIQARESHARHGYLTTIAALLFGAMVAPVHLAAQQVAITYDMERAKIAVNGGSGFWLQGGGMNLAVPIHGRFGIAASISGGHASNIRPDVNLGKVTYLVGPRYTHDFSRMQIFGESLFGGVHGFDGVFPAAAGTTSSANSYAIQLGGGLDIPLRNGFGIRAPEIDYVRTGLPNNGTNSQNDLRLAFGLSYHFNRK
jgi:outer membrane immunogenic protein